MRFANTTAILAFTLVIAAGSVASAQCQGRGQSSGNTSTAASVPYSQSTLSGGYNQNTLNPFGYNQQALAPMLALDQYSRNQRMVAAMQVQSQSLALRAQVTQAQAMAKQMKKESAEMRKAAQRERAENVALREERESAKRSKNYESQRSATRLASLE